MAAQLTSMLRNLDTADIAIRYNPLFVKQVRACARRYDDANLNNRNAIRQELLKRTLKWASNTIYGRPFGLQIRNWPVLEKSAIRISSAAFSRSRRVRIHASTGGTTGTPLNLFRSLGSIAAERFFIEQLLTKHSLDLRRSKVAILRADEVKDPDDRNVPFGIYRNGGRTLVLSNAHLNEDTLPWFVAELKRFQPSILYVYPSMLENLMALLAAASQDIFVPVVLSSSEMVSAVLFDKVSSQLGGQLIDYYGQGERVAFASAEQKNSYRFNPLYGTIELLPVSNRAVDVDHQCYRVIATGHWNPAMPLIRYDTGDLALVTHDDPEHLRQVACGEVPFLGIKGRHSEFLIGPKGEVISGLNHLPKDVPNLVRMQVVQESPSLVRINVLVEKGFSGKDEAIILANARKLFPGDIETNVQVCAELDRRPNGKIPFVIRKSEELS